MFFSKNEYENKRLAFSMRPSLFFFFCFMCSTRYLSNSVITRISRDERAGEVRLQFFFFTFVGWHTLGLHKKVFELHFSLQKKKHTLSRRIQGLS